MSLADITQGVSLGKETKIFMGTIKGINLRSICVKRLRRWEELANKS